MRVYYDPLRQAVGVSRAVGAIQSFVTDVLSGLHCTCHQGSTFKERQEGGHGSTASLEKSKRRWSAYAGQQVQG